MLETRSVNGAIRAGLAGVLVLLSVNAASAAFNFDTDNGATRVVIPKMVPAIREVSPGANDASIVIRIITIVNNAWFDAVAPYHPTAIGVYSNLGRRPAGESATNRNKNIALIYASYRVLNSLLPQNADDWNKMLREVGLDPTNVSTDTTTPVGIGNVAGWAIAAFREHDGMNQLGDEGGRKYNRRPYSDYTGYKPVNTAYDLIDPGRWQPNIVTQGNGLFKVQQFVTPQFRLTKAYTFDAPGFLHFPPPVNSDPNNTVGYRMQADEVLAVSAALTDKQKGIAELFDDKIRSLGTIGIYLLVTRGLTMDEFIQLDFMGHIATFDGGIAAWYAKYQYDAVRPFTAIRYLYGDSPVTAWGGPGRGTVSDLPANEWRPYMNTADHPEYPSITTCFCAAYAQSMRRLFGSDTLGFVYPWLKGSSRVEPGITPSKTVMLGPWATWTDLVHDCGMARLYGGVHFKSAIEASGEICPEIGDRAYEFIQAHLAGNVPTP
jgi:uncharacterized protein DUF6851/vanadium-dependent haloperoxidase-like protein